MKSHHARWGARTVPPTSGRREPGGRRGAHALKFVELLGPTVVGVAVAPVGLDVALADVVLHDPLDPAPPPAGALVLGIGMSADAPSLLRCLQGSPAAVLLKLEGPVDPAAVAQAVARGVAVLTLSAGASWIRVAELAQALTAQSVVSLLEADARSNELIQDLVEVADAVAARVQAPITIEDTQSRLLAYSGGAAWQRRCTTRSTVPDRSSCSSTPACPIYVCGTPRSKRWSPLARSCDVISPATVARQGDPEQTAATPRTCWRCSTCSASRSSPSSVPLRWLHRTPDRVGCPRPCGTTGPPGHSR